MLPRERRDGMGILGAANASASAAAAPPYPFALIQNRSRAAVELEAVVYARHGRECGGVSPL
ncbi:MAG TPA: hypothetical protein VGX03_35065 [Candidatus Binatia bacterium]|nr:hypothetical protein [Candidatus Binatia bacterium]